MGRAGWDRTGRSAQTIPRERLVPGRAHDGPASPGIAGLRRAGGTVDSGYRAQGRASDQPCTSRAAAGQARGHGQQGAGGLRLPRAGRPGRNAGGAFPFRKRGDGRHPGLLPGTGAERRPRNRLLRHLQHHHQLRPFAPGGRREHGDGRPNGAAARLCRGRSRAGPRRLGRGGQDRHPGQLLP